MTMATFRGRSTSTCTTSVAASMENSFSRRGQDAKGNAPGSGQRARTLVACYPTPRAAKRGAGRSRFGHDGGVTRVPIACTLSEEATVDRVDEWRDFLGTAVAL